MSLLNSSWRKKSILILFFLRNVQSFTTVLLFLCVCFLNIKERCVCRLCLFNVYPSYNKTHHEKKSILIYYFLRNVRSFTTILLFLSGCFLLLKNGAFSVFLYLMFILDITKLILQKKINFNSLFFLHNVQSFTNILLFLSDSFCIIKERCVCRLCFFNVYAWYNKTYIRSMYIIQDLLILFKWKN